MHASTQNSRHGMEIALLSDIFAGFGARRGPLLVAALAKPCLTLSSPCKVSQFPLSDQFLISMGSPVEAIEC